MGNKRNFGMKVICIKYVGSGITIGKIYDVLNIITIHSTGESHNYYFINNNNSIKSHYNSESFITLQEHRNNLIKEILE